MTIIPVPFWFALVVAALIMLSGCASDRYLTKEQDDAMRENCEPHGCAVVPQRQWQIIEQLLKQFGLPGA